MGEDNTKINYVKKSIKFIDGEMKEIEDVIQLEHIILNTEQTITLNNMISILQNTKLTVALNNQELNHITETIFSLNSIIENGHIIPELDLESMTRYKCIHKDKDGNSFIKELSKNILMCKQCQETFKSLTKIDINKTIEDCITILYLYKNYKAVSVILNVLSWYE